MRTRMYLNYQYNFERAFGVMAGETTAFPVIKELNPSEWPTGVIGQKPQPIDESEPATLAKLQQRREVVGKFVTFR